MKTIAAKRSYGSSRSLPTGNRVKNAVQRKLQNIKETIFRAYHSENSRNNRLLTLALNEAEAIAWQAGYPELLFPVLATEKVEALAAWNVRQKAVCRSTAELAFAA